MYEYNTSSRANTENNSKGRLVREVTERVFEDGELVSEIVTKEYGDDEPKTYNGSDFYAKLSDLYDTVSRTF